LDFLIFDNLHTLSSRLASAGEFLFGLLAAILESENVEGLVERGRGGERDNDFLLLPLPLRLFLSLASLPGPFFFSPQASPVFQIQDGARPIKIPRHHCKLGNLQNSRF